MGIDRRAQFLFLTTDFTTVVLDLFLPPGKLAFISLQGCASFVQRLARTRKQRLGFRGFSV